jgi:hypothetical protein
VPHLETAMEELTATTATQWLPVQERPDRDGHLRVSFSTRAPFIELIQGNPGGVWSTDDGPRLHHLAYWTDSYPEDQAALAARGLEAEIGGTSVWGGNWGYYRLPAGGARIELCDTAGREAFLNRWGLVLPATPVG